MGDESGWTGAVPVVVTVVSAVAAVASLVVTVIEGRAARRNTEFSVHRDLWWQRWSWVTERAVSDDPGSRASARVLILALTTREWTTADDKWMRNALEDAGFPPGEDGDDDDLEDE